MHRKVAEFATSERACASEKRGPMPTFERHVDVDWKGSVMEGKGEARAGSGAFSLPVTFPSRIGDASGKTSPEELMAAAHAACYAMALNGTLGRKSASADRTVVRATVTAALGAVAFVLMTPIARLAVVVPIAFALILAGLIFAHHERTTIGEAVSAMTLASVAIPLAVASGASMTTAVTCAAAFGSGFVTATICVHAVIAHARCPPGTRPRATAILMTLALLSILVSLRSRGLVASVAPWAAAPSAPRSRRCRPRHVSCGSSDGRWWRRPPRRALS